MEELCRRLGIELRELQEAAARDLEQITGTRNPSFRMNPMKGGASVRGYARITLQDGSRPPTVVLMLLKDPDPRKSLEEVTAEDAVTELPFVNVQRHFKQCGVDVPEIYRYNRERGLLYLEDCGAVHLRDAAESQDQNRKREAFEAAIREMVKIHVDCARRENTDFIGFKVRFDRELLLWELDHFVEHAIRRRFPSALGEKEEETIKKHFQAMVDELLASPYTLQHRDFMLDNIMVQEDRTRVLDFQDAFMGPLAYDLACLLYDRDTATLLGEELLARLVAYYREAYEERSGRRLDPERFQRWFELCVIHRLLKATGRFHFIDQVKKRKDFLVFIPYMLPVIADYLSRDRRWRELLYIFAAHLPELAEHVR